MPDPKLNNWRDQASIDAERTEREAQQQRTDAMRNDPARQELENLLATGTVQEIDTFVNSKVTTVAGARDMFKRILLTMAAK